MVQPEVPAADEPLLASAKAKMLAVRATRVRPGLDDKVLASWNGLMLGAFARASVVLGEERYLRAAERNVEFIKDKLWIGGNIQHSTSNIEHPGKGGGTLYHRWREGERDNVQLLEGYAFMLDGVVQLYEATLDAKHLDFAIALAEAMVAKFYDAANGGFWQSTGDSSDLILRVKDDYDGAEPSGNSVAVLALLKLAAITDREDFKQAGEATLRLFASRLQQQPHALAYMLQALDFWLEEPRRVVISYANSANYRELLQAAHSVYQPNKVVLGTTGAVEAFARTLPAKDGATVYVCTGTACQAPTGDASKVRQMLH